MTSKMEKIKPKDPQNPFRIYRQIYWIYVFTGYWKYESTVKWKKYLFVVYQTILSSIYFVNMILFIVDAYAVRNDLPKFSFNMTSTVLVLITFFKTAMLRAQRLNMEKLLNDLDNHFCVNVFEESEESKKILTEKAESIQVMMRAFYTILFIIYPLRVMASTALYSGSYIIPMPYPERFEEWYAYIYAHQVFIVSHFLVTLTSHDMIVYGVIVRLIAHYEILEKIVMKIKKIYPRRDFERYVPGYKENDYERIVGEEILLGKMNDKESVKNVLDECGFDRLNKFKWEEKKESREERTYKILEQCIHHHQKLLNGIGTFDKIYNTPFLIQASGTVVLLGIVALHIIFVSSEISLLLAQQVLYVLATMMNILGLCTFGSDITNKSRAVASALYDIPWYEMNIKNKKTILFTMKKFIVAPKFKGGGMVVINRRTYLKLIQLSYNMMAVLKNY